MKKNIFKSVCVFGIFALGFSTMSLKDARSAGFKVVPTNCVCPGGTIVGTANDCGSGNWACIDNDCTGYSCN